MSSWKRKVLRAQSAKRNQGKVSPYTSTTNTVVLLGGSFAGTATPDWSDDSKTTIKHNDLLTTYESPLLSEHWDTHDVPQVVLNDDGSLVSANDNTPVIWASYEFEKMFKAIQEDIHYLVKLTLENYKKSTYEQKYHPMGYTIEDETHHWSAAQMKQMQAPLTTEDRHYNRLGYSDDPEKDKRLKLEAAEALERAADVLLVDGWTQGDYHRLPLPVEDEERAVDTWLASTTE